MNRLNVVLIVAGLLIVPGLASASPGLDALSLEDLMDLETDVATRIPQSEREVPGVLTVIHRDQIRRSGARDLLDLLQRVPGLHAELDVQGTLGFAVRGQLADNGRVLLLVDGQVLTEPMYGTSPLGGRFSLDNIQRIEIVRGPAAARYGGGASAAVINIVSVAAEGAEGVRVHAQGCVRPAGVGCAVAGGSAVFRPKDDVRIGLTVHGGDNRMMSGPYKDFWGDGFDAHAVNRVRQLQVVGR
ncbi:MAG: TonB-dependent receptor plug domain-containing protein, partial [Myxococcota bacterium]